MFRMEVRMNEWVKKEWTILLQAQSSRKRTDRSGLDSDASNGKGWSAYFLYLLHVGCEDGHLGINKWKGADGQIAFPLFIVFKLFSYNLMVIPIIYPSFYFNISSYFFVSHPFFTPPVTLC